MKLLKLLKYSEKDPVYILTKKHSLEDIKVKNEIAWENVWNSLPHDRFYIEFLLPTSTKEVANLEGLEDIMYVPCLIFINAVQRDVSVWVELIDREVVLFTNFTNIKGIDADTVPLSRVVLGQTIIPHQLVIRTSEDTIFARDGAGWLWAPTRITVLSFLETLRDKETRLAKETKSYKLEKKKYTSTEVTHVSNIKYLQSEKCEPRHRNLDWTFSWLRAGHWRKIDPGSIGKDRNGDRTQRGRTWVVEATCNDGLPLRVLPRIVK